MLKTSMRVVLSVRTICILYLTTCLYLPQTLKREETAEFQKGCLSQVHTVSILNGPSGLHLLQGEHENFDRFPKVYLPTKMYVLIPSSCREILDIILHMPMYNIICNICINNIERAYEDEIFSPKVKHVFQFIILLSYRASCM